MSGNIVADTSLLVNFFNGLDIAKRVMDQQHLWVSCITEIELLSYSALSRPEERKIRSFLGECSIIDLHPVIKESTIYFRKEQKLKIPDAIIAATSEYVGFPLVTMNSDLKMYLN